MSQFLKISISLKSLFAASPLASWCNTPKHNVLSPLVSGIKKRPKPTALKVHYGDSLKSNIKIVSQFQRSFE